jgi:hypothetical protein
VCSRGVVRTPSDLKHNHPQRSRASWSALGGVVFQIGCERRWPGCFASVVRF